MLAINLWLYTFRYFLIKHDTVHVHMNKHIYLLDKGTQVQTPYTHLIWWVLSSHAIIVHSCMKPRGQLSDDIIAEIKNAHDLQTRF